MEIPFTASVEIPEGVLHRELSGETVILNLNNEHYFGLDEVGTKIWQELSSSSSIQETFDKLLNEFDVDRATLKNDLIELLEKLIDQDLIKLSNDQSD